MAISKEFYEAASKDAALESEVEKAALEALFDLLKEKGLEDEAGKAIEAATQKVASAHGYKPADESVVRLDLDELDSVAGGKCICACPVVGGGGGEGKACGCAAYGEGNDRVDSRCRACLCILGGGGTV